MCVLLAWGSSRNLIYVFSFSITADYHELHKWSVDNHAQFWKAVWEFTDIIHSEDFTEIVEDKSMDQIPKWFKGARLNYAENALRWNDDHFALVCKTRDLFSFAQYLPTFPHAWFRENWYALQTFKSDLVEGVDGRVPALGAFVGKNHSRVPYPWRPFRSRLASSRR